MRVWLARRDWAVSQLRASGTDFSSSTSTLLPASGFLALGLAVQANITNEYLLRFSL